MKARKNPRGVFERPKGSGWWWIRYVDADGKMHREKVGSKSVAVQSYFKRKVEIRESRFVPPMEKRKPSVSFRELAQHAIETKRGHNKASSVANDELMLEIILGQFGAAPASTITTAAIEKFLATLRKDRCGPTVNRYRSLISSVFTIGMRAGKVKENPVLAVPRYPENPGRIRFLDEAEAVNLRTATRAHYPQYEPELDLALNTGIRRGEQHRLGWRDVDTKNAILTLTETKNGQLRHIPLNQAAIAALAKLRAHGSLSVCMSRAWERWFEKCTAAAGIADFTWHDLRHTFASRLVMAGADLRTVQDLPGHKSITMTLRYSHLSAAHRRDAVNRLMTTGTGTEPAGPQLVRSQTA